MKVDGKLYIIAVLLAAFFIVGAGTDDGNEEYAYYADDEEQAQEIADELGASLISYSHGIASVSMNGTDYGADYDMMQRTMAERKIRLYPELLYTVDAPVDQDEEEQWHLDMVKAPSVWGVTMGRGVKVAVIDTGVDGGHEDLQGAIASSVTVIPSERYGSESMFPEEYQGTQDNLGHGTHVAGIIGARKNEYGCTGIAPECSILSIKALEKSSDNQGKGKSSWVAAAVLEAIDAGADIINLSIGGSNIEDELLHEAIIKAYENGIVIVCAAGNAATTKVYYPAGYQETISVSAVRKFGNTVMFASSYSNYGDWIDLCAPGSSIMSTIPGGYGEKTGTSMACPVISGAAALLLSVEPSLTPRQVTEMLEASAIDLGVQGKDDKYGYGMIDIKALLEQYDNARQLSAPKSDIPTGRIVCDGAKIHLATDTLNAAVVYTLDDTSPDIDGTVYPEDGMAFRVSDSPVTIRAITVSSENEISEESVYQYTIVPPVQELLTDRGEYAQEVLPQYGVYHDPVLIKSCRRYKIMVRAGQGLNVTVHSGDFMPEMILFDREDATGMSVAQGDANTPIVWENQTEYDKRMWLSVMAAEETDKTMILTYGMEWYVESEEETTSSENESDTESSGAAENGTESSDMDESDTGGHSELAEETNSSGGASEGPESQFETTANERSGLPPESDTDEKDMLYTMKLDLQEQEETAEVFPAPSSPASWDEGVDESREAAETWLEDESLPSELTEQHSTQIQETTENAVEDELLQDEDTETAVSVGWWIYLILCTFIMIAGVVMEMRITREHQDYDQ